MTTFGRFNGIILLLGLSFCRSDEQKVPLGLSKKIENADFIAVCHVDENTANPSDSRLILQKEILNIDPLVYNQTTLPHSFGALLKGDILYIVYRSRVPLLTIPPDAIQEKVDSWRGDTYKIDKDVVIFQEKGQDVVKVPLKSIRIVAENARTRRASTPTKSELRDQH